MRLTGQEENALVCRYEPYMNKLVRQYIRKNGWYLMAHYEDLMQEARLAFLFHIRSMAGMECVFFCKHPILHALSRYKEKIFIVKIPHEKFNEEHRKVHRVSYDRIPESADPRCWNEDAILTRLMYCGYLKKLAPIEREMLMLKTEGYTKQEILKGFSGFSKSGLYRTMDRLVLGFRRELCAG